MSTVELSPLAAGAGAVLPEPELGAGAGAGSAADCLFCPAAPLRTLAIAVDGAARPIAIAMAHGRAMTRGGDACTSGE
jgi:hypothetical protein